MMEETERVVDATYFGPYKATRLWNDVIATFRQYLPCGRHRRYMKTFDNCFSGSSATDWLHQYLRTNGNFRDEVSRESAISLLNKLYRAGIFEEVKASKSMRHKQDVQENRLYKFLPATPSKVKISRLPLAPRNDAGINQIPLKEKSFSQTRSEKQEPLKNEQKVGNDVTEKKSHSKLARKISILRKEKDLKTTEPKEVENDGGESYPSCHLVTRVLTTREIKDTWKAVFIQRMKKVLGVSSLVDIINTEHIDGYNVMHNCIYLNKSGIVTNLDAKEQLPHWVLSAMKCLARWPEPPEPGLPSYPGFEKDVFAVVKDYFVTQEEPLVPSYLYDVITNVFVMAGNNLHRHTSPHVDNDNASVPSSLWTSASLENIILNLTKKYCLLDNTDSRYGTHEDLRPSSILDQKYGIQEDLRFVGHMDQNYTSYNRSNFPSTDGMDKLAQSHLYATQENKTLSTFSDMKSCDLFHRTSHSAFETNVRSDAWLSGISRKYGSTPNLKVSKYETAFGPDNRTVTRVYYQNGMMTDYGHDDEEGDDNEVHNQIRKKMDRTESNESVNINIVKGLPKNSVHTHLFRSKSFADVASPSQEGTKLLPTNRHKALSVCINRPNGHGSDTYGSCDNINYNQNPNNSFSSNRIMNDSQHKFQFEDSKPHQNTISHSSGIRTSNNDNCHEPAHQTNVSTIVFNNKNSSQRQEVVLTPGPLVSRHFVNDKLFSPLLESGHLNTSQDRSQPSESKVSIVSLPGYFHTTEEKPLPSVTGKTSSVGYYGLGYKSESSSDLYRLNSSPRATSALPAQDRSHVTRPGTDATPVKQISSTSNCFGPGYRQALENFSPAYKPVLDASKERYSLSNTNLASLQGTQPQNWPVSSFPSNGQRTSTPFSPSYNRDYIYSRDYEFPVGIGLSNITPFYSTSHHHGDNVRTSAFMNYPQTRLSEERAKNSLQMVTMLLPPANRRKLHILFKMMMKMTCNPNLCLDPTQTTRSLVLATFYPAIVRSRQDCDFDELVVLQLVSFMLDFYADIFTPPTNIKVQVSDRLKILQRPQVVYSPRPERLVRFCQQTSVTDFENQRETSSQVALENLLENILSDKSMTVKEKMKRLKQFERTYPSIFTRRFPDSQSAEAAVIPQKPKLKQPLMAKRLNKLRNLRL